MRITLEQILKKLDSLPEPPKASVQALNMLEDPNVPLAKVSEFLSLDEILTTKLLKLSNSAYYGYQGKVTTVKEAMMRIGTNIIKSLLYSSMLDNSGLTPTGFFIDLWKSSLFTGMLAKEVGIRLGHNRPDVCFTGGLLCDVGQILLNEFTSQFYATLVKDVRKSSQQIVNAEQDVFGFTHIHVGRRMAELWKLPIIYQNVIRYHHDPALAHLKVLPDDFKLVVAVHIANNLSPLHTDQSGKDIQREVLTKAGFNLNLDMLLQGLSQKYELIQRDVDQATSAMFEHATA